MQQRRRQVGRYLRGMALGALAGCAATVLVPPRVDLGSCGAIGMIEFGSNAEDALRRFVSQEFLLVVQSAQGGVPVLELGDARSVLASVGHERLEPDAVRAIGEKYGIDALFAGSLELSEVKPRVQLSSHLTSLRVRADVQGSLTAKLLDAHTGATVWAGSARAEAPVAHAALAPHGPIRAGARDPEEAYGALVHELVAGVTRDLRPSYVKQ